uniref:Uncharacterized protein n=2 Tax=Babesia bovis TaxID=5865 RepID=A7ATS1_BABBO|eukprot:XP_001609900.1 hypothetical protein [Babesia bovis T2Bo]
MNAFNNYGDDDNEEVEFEGWLKVGHHSPGMTVNGPGKYAASPTAARMCPNCGDTPHHKKQYTDHVHPVQKVERVCAPRGCVNVVKQRAHVHCRCNKGVEISHGDDNDVFYVNNKQHAPKILVQKPQTVIVRNHSRPPIVVQQPPPNVIVKNDPPQPVFVQNCPPNVVVKNERPPPVLKAPGMPMKYPHVIRSGYPPNYIKPCNCPRY